MLKSILNASDVYKLGHMEQYVPGTNRVYSYMCPRSNKNFNECVFFGLQYYLKQYLAKPITKVDANLFKTAYNQILGPIPKATETKIDRLAELGYWPLKIKALPEGTVVPVKNALFTVTTTHPEFYWAGGFVESLILKTWYPTTVATNVLAYKRLIAEKIKETDSVSGPGLLPWLVHDFGYRSDTSEESAAISGAAHLIHFNGSDTIPALRFIKEYYNDSGDGIMASVPASEHSVACSYGPDNEKAYFDRMLELYPAGIVSMISDTYDIWRVCIDYLPYFKDKILARDGKVVIRPDSGNPPDIICGDPEASYGTPEFLGVLRLLDQTFGHTINAEGYKVLNQKIGLIYGDGMYLQRYKNTLERMQAMGYAPTNLVIGVGGILRQGTRDTLGFALKATHVEVNGKPRDILKTPITDTGKHSHCGLLKVYRNENGEIVTKDRCTEQEENSGLLETVFLNGVVTKEYTFNEIRNNALAGV